MGCFSNFVIRRQFWWLFTSLSALSFAACLGSAGLQVRQPYESDSWNWFGNATPAGKHSIGTRLEAELFSDNRFFVVYIQWFSFTLLPPGRHVFRPDLPEAGLRHRVTAPQHRQFGQYWGVPYVQPPGLNVNGYDQLARFLPNGVVLQSTFQPDAGEGISMGNVSRLLLQVPTRLATIGLGVLPVIWYVAFRVRRGRKQAVAGGACPACGYDLRASPDLCPECGTRRRRQRTGPPEPARA